MSPCGGATQDSMRPPQRLTKPLQIRWKAWYTSSILVGAYKSPFAGVSWRSEKDDFAAGFLVEPDSTNSGAEKTA